MHVIDSKVPYDNTKLNAYWHKDCICTINTYGHVGQSGTYQSADTCLSADPGVASSIPTRSQGD